MEGQRSAGNSKKNEVIKTTVGDLVSAITEIALEAGKTELEGYRLASLTVEKILRERRKVTLPQ